MRCADRRRPIWHRARQLCRNAKIAELQFTMSSQQKVGSLEVAMDRAQLFMQIAKRTARASHYG